MLVLSGGADLGGEALGQFIQASGILELELGLPAEEFLQVLQQLQSGLGLLLQTAELLHQLIADFCTLKRKPVIGMNRCRLTHRGNISMCCCQQ